MARSARLDYPGSFHHVMIRGAEGRPVLGSEPDCLDLLGRLEKSCPHRGLSIHAWALLPNHAHFFVESAGGELSLFMREVLTGFSVAYNRRHSHRGHVFMDRFKSILVEKDSYYLELVRYIHLNPIRSGLVRKLEDLECFPWTGHRALASGDVPCWQAGKDLLSWFGEDRIPAYSSYMEFLKAGLDERNREDLTGGNHILGRGGLRPRIGAPSDSRRYDYHGAILGSREFAARIASEITGRLGSCRRRGREHQAMERLRALVLEEHSLPDSALRSSGSRRGNVSAARRQLSRTLSAGGLSFADIARFMGITEAAVRWMVVQAPVCDGDEELTSRYLEAYLSFLVADP